MLVHQVLLSVSLQSNYMEIVFSKHLVETAPLTLSTCKLISNHCFDNYRILEEQVEI